MYGMVTPSSGSVLANEHNVAIRRVVEATLRVTRMLDKTDFRWSALARYLDAAIENALVLSGLANLPIHSHWGTGLAFGNRLDIRIMTEMHSFCLNARKTIEIADLKIGGVQKMANALCRADSRIIEDWPVTFQITDKSFWWCISRILHSQHVIIRYQMMSHSATATKVYTEKRAAYFAFSSDHDMKVAGVTGEKPTHNVEIESFVATVSGVGPLARKLAEAAGLGTWKII